jgi:hypothetical protein
MRLCRQAIRIVVVMCAAFFLATACARPAGDPRGAEPVETSASESAGPPKTSVGEGAEPDVPPAVDAPDSAPAPTSLGSGGFPPREPPPSDEEEPNPEPVPTPTP